MIGPYYSEYNKRVQELRKKFIEDTLVEGREIIKSSPQTYVEVFEEDIKEYTKLGGRLENILTKEEYEKIKPYLP